MLRNLHRLASIHITHLALTIATHRNDFGAVRRPAGIERTLGMFNGCFWLTCAVCVDLEFNFEYLELVSSMIK